MMDTLDNHISKHDVGFGQVETADLTHFNRFLLPCAVGWQVEADEDQVARLLFPCKNLSGRPAGSCVQSGL